MSEYEFFDREMELPCPGGLFRTMTEGYQKGFFRKGNTEGNPGSPCRITKEEDPETSDILNLPQHGRREELRGSSPDTTKNPVNSAGRFSHQE